MKNWLYPETIKRAVALCLCLLYLSGKLEAENLQSLLYEIEQEIIAFEEKWLRDIFSNLENKIEEIIYTESSDQQKNLVDQKVRGLLRVIQTSG